ncbi:MAG: hypothetical protein J6T24_10340, partial [Clostridia bacterium]|nr:hypothetical protein [Clostridia bacterium]
VANGICFCQPVPKNPESIAFGIFSFVPQVTTSYRRKAMHHLKNEDIRYFALILRRLYDIMIPTHP